MARLPRPDVADVCQPRKCCSSCMLQISSACKAPFTMWYIGNTCCGDEEQLKLQCAHLLLCWLLDLDLRRLEVLHLRLRHRLMLNLLVSRRVVPELQLRLLDRRLCCLRGVRLLSKPLQPRLPRRRILHEGCSRRCLSIARCCTAKLPSLDHIPMVTRAGTLEYNAVNSGACQCGARRWLQGSSVTPAKRSAATASEHAGARRTPVIECVTTDAMQTVHQVPLHLGLDSRGHEHAHQEGERASTRAFAGCAAYLPTIFISSKSVPCRDHVIWQTRTSCDAPAKHAGVHNSSAGASAAAVLVRVILLCCSYRSSIVDISGRGRCTFACAAPVRR